MSELRINYLLIAIISSTVTGLIILGIGSIYLEQSLEDLDQDKENDQFFFNQPLEQETTITKIFNEAKDSVVHITSVTVERDFFMRPIPREGTGSGFIISEEGYILTNHHVIKDASELRVTLANGIILKAMLVGTDPLSDTAVIKINSKDKLKPIKLGDSDLLKPGQLAIAIGNPYRLDNTITIGVISALNRTLETETSFIIQGVIQTDAAINPGNSGGPLLNSEGKVIGINTAIYSPIQGSIGIGFAIPINNARKVAEDLIEKGKVTRPWMGITGTTVTEQLAINWGTGVDKGVLIVDIVEEGPADKAGLLGTISSPSQEDFRLGDTIIEMGGIQIHTMEDLIQTILKQEVEKTIEIKFVRNGEIVLTNVTLMERPDNL
jgi:putative serine protease PepD|tara:strand:+ start:4005 stop:5144 length:1140 start_codon:yes stop_codon:yes gene_type:complete